MAKRDANGVPKKFSSKLLQMKFMQRAAARTEAEAAPSAKVGFLRIAASFASLTMQSCDCTRPANTINKSTLSFNQQMLQRTQHS